MDNAVKIGNVVALQCQRDRIKIKDVGYLPHLIQRVDQAAISGGGLIGYHDGGWLIDVHHPYHPKGKGKAHRAVSFGFTSHYAAMREHFGVVPEFVAGENVIVDTADMVYLEHLAPGVIIRTAAGDIEMGEITVAEPCREFTSHLLGLPAPADRSDIEPDLAFLSKGMRGFVAGVEGGPFPIEVGDEVWRRLATDAAT
jgi:hypothetical protein